MKNAAGVITLGSVVLFTAPLYAQSSAESDSAGSVNPLLTRSSLPLEYPPFDLIRDEHFLPSFEQGMTEHLSEVEAIAKNPAPPTFDNTIVALENAGELLGRVRWTFFGLNATLTNPERQAIQRTVAPRLAAHNDAIQLNAELFARIAALYENRDHLDLDPESNRLLWRYHQDFLRAGAQLPDSDKEKLKILNAELATLQTSFDQNVLKERTASAVLVDTRAELAGLSEDEITAAADGATAAGHNGKFLLELINTSGQPPLTTLENRALRQRIMEASLARGSHGGEYDNRTVVSAIARKRAERAALLGFPNHAAYTIANETIGSVERLNELLAQLAPAAVANARREAADLQSIVDREQGGFTVASWDWDFYSKQVREEQNAFDETRLKPYFELNRVLADGIFFAATKLYGLTFKERADLTVYEPTVRVFDVFDADGSQLALFIFDPYARASKQGGAWMGAYVWWNALRGTKPVVANHLNIALPPEGRPTLMTRDEVVTAFHEFGHALHFIFSTAPYPRLGGVPGDFVEYPSQVNEMWAFWPEVLQNYARHYQTDEVLPPDMLAKMEAVRKFNQGYATTEYLAATLLDQAYHQLSAEEVPDPDGILAFEAEALTRLGIAFAPVPPRYRSSYFSHVFSGGYSAGYYFYIWAEVLDAASVDWFKANGGLTRKNGDHFRQTVLAPGGSRDALDLYRDFTGSEPDIKPLLLRRGLAQ